jgi:serine/threonine-protein kinase
VSPDASSPDEPTGAGGETLPATISRYEIRRELGRGTMGVVYEAHDPALGRTIALKTIRLAFAFTPEERANFEERFLVEARTAARLSHPGIVVVHDVGRDAETGTLFIALEHLKGRTLGEILHGGTLPDWRAALRIIGRVAEALHHAHSERVIHRDIKPANIMVLPSGEPKVMDFGIAKIETARIKLTMAGQSFGTPLYMSPEQALNRNLDGRTDLFSLGAVAYSLLTGQLAFGADNLTKIVTLVVGQDPPPPSSVAKHLPPEVDYLLARALAKSPEDRYPNGKALAEDIEDVLAVRPPRHRAQWIAPRHAEGTLVSMPTLPAATEDPLASVLAGAASIGPIGSADLEAELGTLVPEPTSVPEAPVAEVALLRPRPEGRAGTPPSVSRAPRETGPVPVAPARAGKRRALWPTFLALGLAVAVVSVALVLRGGRQAGAPPSTQAPVSSVPTLAAAPSPSPPPPTSAAAVAPEASPIGQPSPAPAPTSASAPPPHEAPSPLPSTPPSAPVATPRPDQESPPALPARERSQLAFDFEHSLKTGTLRVFIDNKLVLEQDLEGRVTKQVVGIKFRKGRIEDVLSVSPGKHEVRVQVAWEDNLKEEVLPGTFATGETRQLEIRLGRIRKNLSLEWT